MRANHGYALDPGLKGLLDAVGVRHQDVLRRAGLPDDLLARPDVRLPTEQFFAFAVAVEDAVRDPRFPITLVDAMSAEWFSPPVFAALCSPDLAVAVTRLARFKPLVAPIHFEIHTADTGDLTVSYDWLESPITPPGFLSDMEALFLVKLARMGTRREIRPAAVTMLRTPECTDAFEAFLGCPIEQGERIAVTFHAADATRPFLTDNSAMWDIFEPQLRKRLADLEGSATFEARTRAVLVEALPSGQVSVDAVARRLAVSPRTLQRRLREEGTSFNSVVQGTRERLSRHYLGSTRLSSSEIAYLLGFEEPNSFFRAFQSWTGMTPETLRRSLQD